MGTVQCQDVQLCIACAGHEVEVEESCGGSIRFTLSAAGNATEFVHIETQRRVKLNNVTTVEVQGNCCFSIHTRRNFFGRSEYLTQAHGARTPQHERVRSIQKVPCFSTRG